ncbi:MAG: hypothetical protein ACT4QG_07210 [Sporichthyaceae bacterium]
MPTAEAPVLAGTARRSRPAAARTPLSERPRLYLTQPTPWRRAHVTRALIPALLGAVVSAVCWWQISGKVTLEAQQGWFVGSFLGAAIAALGGVYFLLVNLREVYVGKRQLVADLAEVMDWPLTRDGRVRGTALAGDEIAGDDLVTGPGMTLVHRADCQVARGKAMFPATVAEAGYGRCGICLPGDAQ